MKLGTTVIEHLLDTQKKTPEATGAFTRLLNGLIVAAKLISREINKAGLADLMGYTGRNNVHGEKLLQLDDFAKETITHRVQSSGEVCAMASDESPELISMPRQQKAGNYVVLFDPIDSSSNLESNISIGTIFSFYKRVTPGDDEGTLDDVLQPGHRQVAAGYFLYGSSTVMIFTAGNGVHCFTLDPSVGEFILSEEDIRIPETGKIYSVNEGHYRYWDENVRNYIDYLKDPEASHHHSYTSRYIGGLVADFHRNLLNGGIFLYPADHRDSRQPTGKLRLTTEANPLAMLAEAAGGAASTGHERIMDIIPNDIHQRVPLIIGSKEEVRIAEQYISGQLK